MSLSRLALRLATVHALKGQTIAADRVKDSAIASIDALADGQKAPFISVYTDDAETSSRSADTLFGSATVNLVIEMAIVARADVDGQTLLAHPPTDATIESELDRMERRISIALRGGTEWAAVWRRFVLSIDSIKSVRGGSAEKGNRFAARQMEFAVAILAEPAPGQTPAEAWTDLLGLLDASPDLASIAAMIREELDGSGSVEEMKRTHYAPVDRQHLGNVILANPLPGALVVTAQHPTREDETFAVE